MNMFNDLVNFNRYKSVESFNSATDITSSTISFVKLDENIMDIYLGRTKLTRNNVSEINIEGLIESFETKLDSIKDEFDTKLLSNSEEYNKIISEYIQNFENGSYIVELSSGDKMAKHLIIKQ